LPSAVSMLTTSPSTGGCSGSRLLAEAARPCRHAVGDRWFCILTDIVQGPVDILYGTSNNPILLRFNVATGTFLAPIDIPNSNAVAGDLAVHGDDIWFTDFNNDSLWRYNITAGQFTQFPVPEPSDAVVDNAGDVWFTAPLDGSIDRLDPATGAVESFPVPDGLSPRQITIATDGQIWFTSRFALQGVGRLNPATGVVATFPTPSNPGPEGIAASPDGSIWCTQDHQGQHRQDQQRWCHHRGQGGQGQRYRSGSPSRPTGTRGTR
jgi:streptogramin lyase